MKKIILTAFISTLIILGSFNNTGINAQTVEPNTKQPPKALKDKLKPVKVNPEPLILDPPQKSNNKVIEKINEEKSIVTSLTDPLRQLELDMVFVPNKDIIAIQPSLKDKIQAVTLNSTDNQQIKVWYIAPVGKKDTVLYCHGNKVNMTTKQNVAEFLSQNGYGVLMADYRGYGYNNGTPTEQGMYDDATTALRYLNEDKGIKTKDLLLWGHSLGGGVASQLASTNTFKGVILNNTFTSIKDMAKVAIIKDIKKSNSPLKDYLIASTIVLPKDALFLIKPKFDNLEKVSKIQSPLLILSSEQDEVIPYYMSQELANKQPKAKYVLSATGAHSALDWLKPVVLEFFKSIK